MTSECPHCSASRVTVSVPTELTTYTSSPAISYCQRCLSVEASEPAAATDEPSFEAIHTRFPTGDVGVGMLVLIDKLDSLALNRSEIESLIEYLESNGVDLFLTLDRLLAEPTIEPRIDLGRRRTQLDSLLK